MKISLFSQNSFFTKSAKINLISLINFTPQNCSIQGMYVVIVDLPKRLVAPDGGEVLAQMTRYQAVCLLHTSSVPLLNRDLYRLRSPEVKTP